ncbi:hypothetical protein AVEN_265887-1 [Araneus ventricosus]|uniref:Uncharacterized protein n=1 Tax=Araneus ventricosus TaxID=182803 RepID=A0A4Y2QUU3_ARAVE|nr:hypothetical protein AVEN_265887-1 [Araneus ventricosus]
MEAFGYRWHFLISGLREERDMLSEERLQLFRSGVMKSQPQGLKSEGMRSKTLVLYLELSHETWISDPSPLTQSQAFVIYLCMIRQRLVRHFFTSFSLRLLLKLLLFGNAMLMHCKALALLAVRCNLQHIQFWISCSAVASKTLRLCSATASSQLLCSCYLCVRA